MPVVSPWKIVTNQLNYSTYMLDTYGRSMITYNQGFSICDFQIENTPHYGRLSCKFDNVIIFMFIVYAFSYFA